MARAKKSWGFGKRFGIFKGPYRAAKTGTRAGGKRVLAIKHKGPKNVRAGKIRYFDELAGSGQSGFAQGRR